MILDAFTKTYSDRNYKFPAFVRHNGTVVAFAMDEHRRIYYSVLDLNNADIKSPLDVNFWVENPRELRFATEIAQVGFGIADQRAMPRVRKGSTQPAQNIPDDELDPFLSSTARLTADAPFAVISDNPISTCSARPSTPSIRIRFECRDRAASPCRS